MDIEILMEIDISTETIICTLRNISVATTIIIMEIETIIKQGEIWMVVEEKGSMRRANKRAIPKTDPSLS